MTPAPPKYIHVSLADLGPDCDLNLWIKAGRVTYLANLPRLYIRTELEQYFECSGVEPCQLIYPDGTWSSSSNYCWLRFNSDSHARAAERALHCYPFEGRLLQAVTAIREPRLPLHNHSSLPSDATIPNPDPQPEKALHPRREETVSSDRGLPQSAKLSEKSSSNMVASQSIQRPMEPVSGNVDHQQTPRTMRPSLATSWTQPAPALVLLAITGAVGIKAENGPTYTHKFYDIKDHSVHWTKRRPRPGIHIDVQRIPSEFHEGRIVRRTEMDRFLRAKEMGSCDVIWPERDEEHPLNFHCWLSSSYSDIQKGKESSLQKVMFNESKVYQFKDSEAPAVRAKQGLSKTVSRANKISSMYTHLAEIRCPLSERTRSIELGLLVYVSGFPRGDFQHKFALFLRGVGVEPCKLFWPHLVAMSTWNNKCWLQFSEPGHAAAAVKILTSAPFWYRLKATLNAQIEGTVPLSVIRSTPNEHGTSVGHLVEETEGAVTPAHNEMATFTHGLCYDPQMTSTDIENWVRLGFLVLVWGFEKFEQQSKFDLRRGRLEETFEQKGVASCNIIWPHRGSCDFFWLKFSHPDHATAAIAILGGATFEGGSFSAVLGDRPDDCPVTVI